MRSCLSAWIKIVVMIFSIGLMVPCFADTVTVTLDKTCSLDMRLWQVGTPYTNVMVNADKKTFTVNFPVGTKVCAYVNQNTYCPCWGYKYCEASEPESCPTGGGSKDILVFMIGGCATTTKDKTLEIPINCSIF